jgi:hypothetical protein
MHNYWFTANAAPAASTGSVTIDLFKPGTPGLIVATGLPVPSIELCIADYDTSGAVAIDDVFSYVNSWLASEPRADINHVNGLTQEDIFDFVNIWFVGC